MVYKTAKIKGAIRTDFILSAEIIVIVLGIVHAEPSANKVTVVSLLALAITVVVYGSVASIVKLDYAGLYLPRKSVFGNFNSIQRAAGSGLKVIDHCAAFDENFIHFSYYRDVFSGRRHFSSLHFFYSSFTGARVAYLHFDVCHSCCLFAKLLSINYL